jgi:hypothetical protein
MTKINWKGIMNNEVRDALHFFQNAGIKPNLRTLFYRLVSMNVIPNNVNAYKGLSRQLVKYRKNGTYDWDCIEDRARQSYGTLSDKYTRDNLDTDYEDQLKDKLDELSVETLLKEYLDWLKPNAYVQFWSQQPVVCEIWIEKEALTTTLQSFTSGLGVKIRPNRGYSSWTFLKEAVEELKNVLDEHDHVHILYLGDLDPSGVDIDRYIKEVMDFFGLDHNKITFERICVTVDQVDTYELPPKPEDAQTLAKLQRDPRTANYTLDYVVELDSLLAFVPDAFRTIVREKVKSLHDPQVFGDLRAEADKMNKRIQRLHDDYRQKCKDKMLTELS